MSKLKKKHIKELIICLICCAVPVLWGFSHVQHFAYTESLFVGKDANIVNSKIIHNGVETIKLEEIQEDTASGKFMMKHYSLENGDTLVSGSLQGATDEAVVLQSLHITGDATIHYLGNGQFEVSELKEGSYNPSLFFVDSDNFDIACYLPQQYRYLENDALEYLPDNDGYLNVKKTSDGFDIELISQQVEENCCSDFLLVYSSDDLMNWKKDDLDATWLFYTMDGDNRWTYTGYYRKAAHNYIPTGDNVYARCQACYLGASFINAEPRYRAMDDMLTCIIDIMAQQQNEMGYFPSTSESTWLSEDYNIGASYYDTRFNSDLIEIMIKGYTVYQNSSAYNALKDYIGFFTEYAEKCGRDDGNGGLWIPDYWKEDCNIDLVHTSLNHQLSEINVLYKLSNIFNDKNLEILADRMLAAVTNLGMKWVRYDGELEYAIFPDGSFGLQDYDTLTYNDMFKLQSVLEDYYGERNETIDKMMAAKLRWMKNHYITDYLQ